MFNGYKPAPGPGGGRKWLPLALLGSVAVVAGILLPQMLGSVAPAAAHEAPPATAADGQKGSLEYVPPNWPDAPDASGLLTRLGIGTAVVLVLCVVTLLVCRRWLRRLPGPEAANTRMVLVETLPLGNRCQVHLVRVGKQQVLVGLDGAGLKSLVALPEAFDEALVEAQEAPATDTPPIATAPALAALVGPAKPAAW
jgi:flagellar biogenesis protein FliO